MVATTESTVEQPQLDPFVLPEDFQFEEELQGEAPRPIPPELYQGRYAIKQKRAATVAFILGIGCLILAVVPFVQEMGTFIPLLEYLLWIGVGLIAIGAIINFSSVFSKGPYRYVEEGIPIPVKILSLWVKPSVFTNGVPSQFQFRSWVTFIHPDTSEQKAALLVSEGLSEGEKKRLNTSYRVGDFVTAVYLPGEFEKTFRLYGFLDLRPGLGLIPKDPTKASGVLSSVLTSLGIVAFGALVLGLFHVASTYRPLALRFEQFAPLALGGGVLIGLPLFIFGFLQYRREQKARIEANKFALEEGRAVDLTAAESSGKYSAIKRVFLVIFMGAVTVVLTSMVVSGLLLAVNGMADSGEPVVRPVVINDMIQTTHRVAFIPIFRVYEIKYRFSDDEENEESQGWQSTPAHMDTFDAPIGLAIVKPGTFGWAWVKSIEPVTVKDLQRLVPEAFNDDGTPKEDFDPESTEGSEPVTDSPTAPVDTETATP